MTRFSIVFAMAALLSGPALAATFARADVSHDGFVSYEEAKIVYNGLNKVYFNKFDYDNDGLLDQGEWAGFSNFYTLIEQN